MSPEGPQYPSCPVCGEPDKPGHDQKHGRDGGGVNPPPDVTPETKAWPPQGIETK